MVADATYENVRNKTRLAPACSTKKERDTKEKQPKEAVEVTTKGVSRSNHPDRTRKKANTKANTDRQRSRKQPLPGHSGT